jgi:spermidine/putrescine transport system permease protein
MVALVYLFLYIPISALIVLSFNDNQFGYQWNGFTTQWYWKVFESEEVWNAFKNSILVASFSVALSLVLGALLVLYVARNANFSRILSVFYINLAVPEVVLAVGMLMITSFVGIPLGITSLIAGHTILGLGYAVPIIYDRYVELDKRLMEASLDLGATPTQTFFKIILPLLYPAVLAAGLLIFIISFDDFVISFFCSTASTQTLPIYIFSRLRAGASPEVNALSTLLLVMSSVMVLLFSLIQVKKADILK